MLKENALKSIKKLSNCIVHDSCEETDCCYFLNLYDLYNILIYINNSNEIVRCKECKWYYKGSNKSDDFDTCRLADGPYDVFDEFYCAHGERNEKDII